MAQVPRNQCFWCQKTGHWAKDCPIKAAGVPKLNTEAHVQFTALTAAAVSAVAQAPPPPAQPAARQRQPVDIPALFEQRAALLRQLAEVDEAIAAALRN